MRDTYELDRLQPFMAYAELYLCCLTTVYEHPETM